MMLCLLQSFRLPPPESTEPKSFFFSSMLRSRFENSRFTACLRREDEPTRYHENVTMRSKKKKKNYQGHSDDKSLQKKVVF